MKAVFENSYISSQAMMEVFWNPSLNVFNKKHLANGVLEQQLWKN